MVAVKINHKKKEEEEVQTKEIKFISCMSISANKNLICIVESCKTK